MKSRIELERPLVSTNGNETETKLDPLSSPPKEQLSRRDFFRKFVPKSSPEKELAEVREQLLSPDEEQSEEPSGESQVMQPEPTKYSRRKMLGYSLAAFGTAALGFFKWDKLLQWKHQLERKEIPAGLAGVVEKIKDLYPNVNQEADPTEWAAAIENAFREVEIPSTEENIGIVLTLIAAESGFRAIPRAYDYSPLVSEDEMQEVNQYPRTGGPMELAYIHVQDWENISYEEAVAKVDTIEGGLRYSLIYLKEIISAYSQVQEPENRLAFIFADWNAGSYHCRNAGLQKQINELTGSTLALDGIFGEQTASAIVRNFAGQGLTPDQVSADLNSAYTANFPDTLTWQVISQGREIEPVVANVKVLGWYGDLKKVSTGVGNSKEFSEERLQEYQSIIKLVEEMK